MRCNLTLFRTNEPRPLPVYASSLVTCVLVAAAFVSQVRATEPEEPATKEDIAAIKHFETHIRPVLVEKCVSCHGANKQESELRLDTLAAAIEGGDSGPAIEPGDLDASLLIEAIRYDGFEMPPSEKLDDETIRHFEQWVADGAVWPEGDALRDASGEISDEDRQWWAFQPLDRALPPKPTDSVPAEVADAITAQTWARWQDNPIDRFALQKMRSAGLSPAPPADEMTLLRRLYLDLHGVIPTPEQVADFMTDDAADRWPALVDRLLDDPAYGEHWARHWLDLVRYCESDGWNQDAFRPHIHRYRDWVIDAFNSDMPYPEFVRKQLAGDEIESDDPSNLVAAGYLRLGIYEYNQRDARNHWNDIMNELTDVTGDVFLGLSMSCSRCHDHKFDPILQRDYFKLRAFFEGIAWRDDLVAATNKQKAEYAAQNQKWLDATAEIRSKIAAIERPYEDRKWKSTVDKFPVDIQACFHMPVADRTSWQNQMAYLVERQYLEEGGGPFKNMKKEDKEKREKLEKELAKFDDIKPKPLPRLMTATDFSGLISPTCVQDDASRTPIPPGFLSVMTTDDRPAVDRDAVFAAALRPDTSGRRTALAKWIGDSENPLTTRLVVNRVWQQHFGRGLVATSSDFGTLGQRPSHPGLLDWLTAQYVDNGWSLKDLHRLILNSQCWQQSSDHPDASQLATRDPAEQLLWRWRVRRLTAEQLRDSMLVATGELDRRCGGASVETSKPRRSIYLKSFRNKNDTFLHGFDFPPGLRSVAVRDSTTTPTQALLLLNGKFALSRAEKLAKRLLEENAQSPEAVIEGAYQSVWSREPSGSEIDTALDYLDISSGEDRQLPSHDRLTDFCHVLLNSNQFLYVD